MSQTPFGHSSSASLAVARLKALLNMYCNRNSYVCDCHSAHTHTDVVVLLTQISVVLNLKNVYSRNFDHKNDGASELPARGLP